MDSRYKRRGGANGKKHKEETRMLNSLKELDEFYKFREEILPVLRKALEDGLSAESIYAKYQAYAAARAVSIAATEVDSGKALAAIKDILDRSGGKAKERSEVVHKLADLPEEQLDSLILSKLKGAEDEQEEQDIKTKPSKH